MLLWTQDVFTTKERILGDIRLRTLDYANGMYEDVRLMEDTVALFPVKPLSNRIFPSSSRSIQLAGTEFPP